MVAIPPRRLAQLRPGADVGMISASARRPALPLSQARGAHILAGAQFRSASHSASPTDLPCHARNQASVATPRESWGSGSTDTPVPAVEERGGCGGREQRIAFTRGVDTHLGSGRGRALYGGIGEGGKEGFWGRRRHGGWWEKERGGTNMWQFGQYLLPRSMIAERILDTPPTVGKCVELSSEPPQECEWTENEEEEQEKR
ncbi:hypothetical protein B0H14DRAFT_2630711 [Mycena olivaceomarginata]|nr:hypothetical protein B0H14DRAFT_2630711 [Mycena olivaceomarginata]